MNTWDMLAAIASGVGQGAANKQQQEQTLRQQALENALLRQKMDLEQAKFAEDQRQFNAQLKATADLAKAETDAKLAQKEQDKADWLTALQSTQTAIGGPALKIGETPIPYAYLREGLSLDRPVESLSELITRKLTGGEAPQAQGPLTIEGGLYMRPNFMQVAEATAPQLERSIQESGRGTIDVSSGPSGVTRSLKMLSPTEAARAGIQLRTEEAGALSAEAKAGFDIATLPNRIDNIRLDREKTIRDMQATDQTITINAPKVLAAMTELGFWLANPQLLDEHTKTRLENDYVKLANETAWYKAHPGQTTTTWSATQQILMAQASLDLRWQEYKNPIPTPPAPPRPGSLTQVESSSIAQANKIIAQIGAGKKDPETGAKEIESLPAFPTQKQLAGQARTTKSTTGTRWWQSYVPGGVKPQGQ